ncbi:MAG: TadE family protein [Candidatus Dormibacteria bacterium]
MGNHYRTSVPAPASARHRRNQCQRGQSITEFALVLPVAILVLALAATGGQMLMAGIDLTQAARAGAVAAQASYNGHVTGSGETYAACAATLQEMGVSASTCPAAGGTPPIQVAVTNTPDSATGVPTITVTATQQIDAFLPIFGSGLTVKVAATAGGAAASGGGGGGG